MSKESQNNVPRERSQRRIGITGGIASGKSSIGRYLQEIKKLPILDADIYAHEALLSGEESTNLVIHRYGEKITKTNLNGHKIIDRHALGNIIFENTVEKQWLENLIHPIVKKRFSEEIQNLQNEPTVILIVPLLFETNINYLCNETWLIYCTLKQQYERLLSRDNLSLEDAKRRIESQLSMDKKINLCDVVINNNGEINSWKNQVDDLIY